MIILYFYLLRVALTKKDIFPDVFAALSKFQKKLQKILGMRLLTKKWIVVIEFEFFQKCLWTISRIAWIFQVDVFRGFDKNPANSLVKRNIKNNAN